jgi:hypothetical protein
VAAASAPLADSDANDDLADEEAVLDIGIVVGVAEVAVLELKAPPRTCAKLITPTLLAQQSILVPQHQRSLSARPLHGVKRAWPKSSLELGHRLRHLLLVTSFSVQKLFQYLGFRISKGSSVERDGTYDTVSMFLLSTQRFLHNPFGKHSSFVKPFVRLPPGGSARLRPQQIVVGPDEHGMYSL